MLLSLSKELRPMLLDPLPYSGKKKKAVEPSEDEDLFEEGLDFEILRGDVNNVVEHLEKDFSRLRAGGADASKQACWPPHASAECY